MEYRVLKQLVGTEHGMTVEEIANKLKRHPATVHRALSKLLTKGLCQRKTEYLAKGGYYYRYYVLSEEHLKAQVLSCVEQWYNAAKNQMNEFQI